MGDIVIPTPVADRIRGQERLEAAPVDLTSFAPLSPSLLALSQRSARKCICEGREGTASVPIYRCTTCNHSSCANCKAKPEHTYVLEDNERVAPDVFEAEAKSMLPMRFSLAGFGKEALEAKRVEVEKEGVKLDGAFVDTLIELIAEALVGAEVGRSFSPFRSLTDLLFLPIVPLPKPQASPSLDRHVPSCSRDGRAHSGPQRSALASLC